jgi:ABC-type transport system substrate-binding protein
VPSFSTLLDPSDYFNAWYTKDGPQNYSFWDNKEFQALVPRIDREVDAKKRLTLIRRAESVMEPLVPVAWEKINDVWYNYVKGHNPPDYFGIYDVGQRGYSVAGQGLRYCSSPPRKRGSRSAAEPWIPEFPLSRE